MLIYEYAYKHNQVKMANSGEVFTSVIQLIGIHPTSSVGEGYDTRLPKMSCHTNVKETSLTYYLCIAEGRKVKFIISSM